MNKIKYSHFVQDGEIRIRGRWLSDDNKMYANECVMSLSSFNDMTYPFYCIRYVYKKLRHDIEQHISL